MRHTLALLALLNAFAMPVYAQQTKNPADEVRSAETAFAKSMADRNFAAFTALLADDTVFWGGKGVNRGKAAVAADWKRFFDGPSAPFSDRKSTRLNSSHLVISYAVFC